MENITFLLQYCPCGKDFTSHSEQLFSITFLHEQKQSSRKKPVSGLTPFFEGHSSVELKSKLNMNLCLFRLSKTTVDIFTGDPSFRIYTVINSYSRFESFNLTAFQTWMKLESGITLVRKETCTAAFKWGTVETYCPFAAIWKECFEAFTQTITLILTDCSLYGSFDNRSAHFSPVPPSNTAFPDKKITETIKMSIVHIQPGT